MKFFIISLDYLVPMERVAEVVTEHRRFLDAGYERGWFLASGPRNPKTGGMIVARAPSREALEAFLKDDPFQAQGIAAYHFVEFEPVKTHSTYADFFKPAEE